MTLVGDGLPNGDHEHKHVFQRLVVIVPGLRMLADGQCDIRGAVEGQVQQLVGGLSPFFVGLDILGAGVCPSTACLLWVSIGP